MPVSESDKLKLIKETFAKDKNMQQANAKVGTIQQQLQQLKSRAPKK